MDRIPSAQSALFRIVIRLDLSDREGICASGDQRHPVPGVVIAVLMACEHDLRALPDRFKAGDLIIIIGVDHNAVSALFDLKTRVSDPCDFHISPPGMNSCGCRVCDCASSNHESPDSFVFPHGQRISALTAPLCHQYLIILSGFQLC